MSNSKDKNVSGRFSRKKDSDNSELDREKYDVIRRAATFGHLPEWTNLSFSDRLKYALLRMIHLYDTDEEIEQEIGRSMKQLGRYIDSGDLPLSVLASMSKHSLTPMDWLLATQEEYSNQLSEASEQVGQKVSSVTAENFAFIPRLDVSASAGNGSVAMSEEADGMLAFRAEWLRRRGINPKMASALTANGDSMEPTIRDGDTLLVDRSIDRVKDNGIYVVVIGGLLVVKRVHTSMDGSITLLSENSVYPPETVKGDAVNDLVFAGRVMWFGRSI